VSTNNIDYDALAKSYGAVSSTPQAPPQTQGAPQGTSEIDYDSLAKQYGAVSSQPAQPAEKPGLISRVGNYLQQVHEAGPVEMGKGFLKGMGETATNLFGDPTGEGDTSFLSAKVGMDPDAIAVAKKDAEQFHKEVLPSANPGQEVGKGIEMLTEFFLADSAFKGMTALDKVRKLERVAKAVERYPAIAKILQRSVQTGLATGAVETAKTGDLEEGAKAAVVGSIAGGLGEGAFLGAKAAKTAVPKIVSSFWDSVTGRAVQSDLQAGIRGTLEATAKDAEVATVRNGAQPAIRNSAKSVSESVEKKAKGLFQQIDDVTDGKLTNVQRKIKNVQRELSQKAGTDPAAEERLLEQQAALASELEDLFAMAEREGVPVEVADQARSAWKQSSALADLDTQIKMSTYGEGKHAAEVVDPQKLVNRLQKLQDSGRLEEAVGEEQADRLLKSAYDAAKAAKSHGKTVGRAKTAAKIAGAGVIGKLGLDALAGE
jgi:hypothetical protein